VAHVDVTFAERQVIHVITLDAFGDDVARTLGQAPRCTLGVIALVTRRQPLHLIADLGGVVGATRVHDQHRVQGKARPEVHHGILVDVTGVPTDALHVVRHAHDQLTHHTGRGLPDFHFHDEHETAGTPTVVDTHDPLGLGCRTDDASGKPGHCTNTEVAAGVS